MPRKYPQLPTAIRCPGGVVPVAKLSREEMQKMADPGEELMGYYNEKDREIFLLDDLTLAQSWRILWHEWCHVVLEDSGLANSVGHDQEEAFCDAIAAARIMERFG